ncbi:MAG: ATP-binding protein, partial [Chloroflexota bacterium]
LATEFDTSAPKVLCDRNQIAQVLINLLNNARDAMPQGGVITLRTRQTAAGAVIEVADQGLGIPPDSLSKVFDPFYTTKEIGKGSGLGLSIVAGIVRAHNGTVEAHSEGPERGTTFTITLPIASSA